jgi:hypothetical protein
VGHEFWGHASQNRAGLRHLVDVDSTLAKAHQSNHSVHILVVPFVHVYFGAFLAHVAEVFAHFLSVVLL